MLITRYSRFLEAVGITTAIGTTQVIDVTDVTHGTINVPTVAGASLTTLTYWHSPKKDGTYLPLYDTAGSPIVQTVAHTQAHPLHSAVVGSRYLKLVGNAAGEIELSLNA